MQFTATGPGGSSPPVIWTVNDGGATSVGAISPGGLYVAPIYVNQPVAATITATDQRDATAKGSVTATIVAQRLAAAGQGVSVAFARAVTSSLQTSISAVVGGNTVNKSVQTSVSARIGGEPSATASTAVSVNIGPVITAVSPATGARGATGLAVTLAGAGFTDATLVTFLKNNVADSTVTATLVSVSPDGTQATLSVSIASGATTGPRVVKITTPADASTVVGTGANVFTVQ